MQEALNYMLRYRWPDTKTPAVDLSPYEKLKAENDATLEAMRKVIAKDLSELETHGARVFQRLGQLAGTLHANVLKAGRLTHDLTNFPQGDSDQEHHIYSLIQGWRRIFGEHYSAARDEGKS
jgi:hypothetical protein